MSTTSVPSDSSPSIEKLYRYGQVGLCVNSVAHDVNNYLGAVLAYAELLGFDDALSADSRRMLQDLAGAVKKCSTLVAALTGIGRKERPSSVITDPARLVEQVVCLRAYSLKSAQIKYDVICPPNLPSVVTDLPKITLALMYMIMNAEEAAAGTEGASVSIRVEDTGPAVALIVWNSGPVIPEAERERIFEPYYTTKGDVHIGLGLTMARGYAREHEGDLIYTPDKGFILTLPKQSG